jgi:flagellar hook assembly protein FlgD
VLSVYNILGKKVVSLVDKQQPAGSHLVTWDGRDSDGRMVGSGVYFYRIESGDFSKTYKMIFMK